MNPTQHESHFSDANGKPAGGISTGFGYTIGWQNGPCPIMSDGVSQPDRNGAFLIEVLEACRARAEFYQEGEFACEENAEGIASLTAAIGAFSARRDRRKAAGILGTHETD